MSRLDQHVAAVQNKLTLSRFINALGWTILAFAIASGIFIVALRLTPIQVLPHARIWFFSGLGVAILGALSWSMLKRPSRQTAAVAIDEKLGLHAKISTALFMRNNTDPFAMAAVKDAESTAEKVVRNVNQHFPMNVSRVMYATGAAVLASAVLYIWFPNHNLFASSVTPNQQKQIEVQRDRATAAVKQALATVQSVPKSLANDDAIKKAQIDLNNLLKQPIKDPAAANRSALKALEDAKEALKRQAESNSKFAEAQDMMKDLSRNILPPNDENGPIADAQRKIAEGKFTEAFNKLDEAVSKFDKMDDKQKEEAAKQMQQMAKQLQQAAGDPQKQQQQIAKQMQQQLGMNQQQAQQLAQQVQQAAQGNKQAQQQVQQAMQQMAKQMNNGKGPTPGQQQQMQQAMQQMQAQANNSATAGQMAQAAQQMAQAMQQSSNGQNPGQQQQGQQMSQGLSQMQQQMQNMEGAAQDAQQIAAAQQAMQQAADQQAGNCNGGQGDDGGQLGGRKDGANPWAAGDPNGKGNGMGNAGIGAGGRAQKQEAPFAMKPQMSPSADNEKGRILASNYIKDDHPIAGKSGESLKSVAQSAEQEAADEIDGDHISRQAQSAVKKYFQSMEETK